MNSPNGSRSPLSGTPNGTARAVGLLSSCLVLGWILFQNIDLYSYLPDDGAYAYVADRINQGDVLHRDIQDVHAGYINFSNAFALRLFGRNMLSMRYPLLALTLLQVCVVFWMMSRNSLLCGLLSAGTMGTLTFLQFLNPTANWYCLFLVVMVSAVFSKAGPISTRRLLAVGALIGFIFMFRQLTGVIVGCAALLIVLLRASETQQSTQRFAVLTVLIPVTLALILLLYRTSNLGSIALIGAWPVMICMVHMRSLQGSNFLIFRQLATIFGGFVLSATPLIAYHVYNASYVHWWNDAFRAALSLSEMQFISSASFFGLGVLIVEGVAENPGLVALINGTFWITLLLAPMCLGFYILKFGHPAKDIGLPPIAYLASFYGLVSLHYQIPTYLLYSSALTLTGLLAASSSASTKFRIGTYGTTVFCIIVGLTFHAAKPLAGKLDHILRGAHNEIAINCNIPRLGLRIEARQCRKYSKLIRTISELTAPTDTILVLPANPELYFLSDRASTLWFFNSSLGIRNSGQLATALEKIDKSPPALVLYHPLDKYNTPMTELVMKDIQLRFRLLDSTDGIDVYGPIDLPASTHNRD